MKFRITKHSDGWIVEVQKSKWYGKKYWTTFITYYGLREKYYHTTYGHAETNLLDSIKWDTLRNSDGTH